MDLLVTITGKFSSIFRTTAGVFKIDFAITTGGGGNRIRIPLFHLQDRCVQSPDRLSRKLDSLLDIDR